MRKNGSWSWLFALLICLPAKADIVKIPFLFDGHEFTAHFYGDTFRVRENTNIASGLIARPIEISTPNYEGVIQIHPHSPDPLYGRLILMRDHDDRFYLASIQNDPNNRTYPRTRFRYTANGSAAVIGDRDWDWRIRFYSDGTLAEAEIQEGFVLARTSQGQRVRCGKGNILFYVDASLRNCVRNGEPFTPRGPRRRR